MFTRKLLRNFILGNVGCVLAMSVAYAAVSPTIKMQTTKPIYTWKTESENNKTTGQFDHCMVKNMYDNGTLMILAQNNDGVKRLALDFPQAKLQPGQRFDLTAQVDKSDVFPVEATAISQQTLGIAIPDALPDQMRKGQALHVRGPSDEVVYTLQGMDGAVMALQDCMISQKNMPQSSIIASADTSKPMQKLAEISTPELVEKKVEKPVDEMVEKPIAMPAAPAPIVKQVKPVIASIAAPRIENPKIAATPIEAPKMVAAPIELPKQVSTILPNPIPTQTIAPVASVPITTKLADKIDSLRDTKVIEVADESKLPQPWANTFAGTDYAADKLIPMKNKKPNQPLDYIWKKQDVFIGVKQPFIQPGDQLQTVSVDYLKMLKGRCAGTFVAESTQVQQSPKNNIAWQEAEAACSNSKTGDSIAAMIFAFTPQGGQIYFFESSANQGAGAIKARDAILKKLLN